MGLNVAPPAGVSRELVATFNGWRYEDIPSEVVERLKLLVLDTLGVIAAASGQREVDIVSRRLTRWSVGGSATVLLGKTKMPPPFAALINGTAAHALDFDDIHDAARVHTFAVLLPALLAVAEDEGGVSGRDFLLALAIGAELNARLGLAAPRTLAIGWHPSTILGAVSTGLAVARLMGLDTARQLGALGFGHHLAAGSSESILSGAPSKRVGLGFAAQAGVMAASLAADGISGPGEPLAGRAGLFALQQRGEVDPAQLVADLGQRWEILAYQVKPYPCCRCCHSAISLGVGLHGDGVAPDAVARIDIALSRLNAETVGAVYEPARNSPSHAQFNAAFCFAAALADGQVGVSTFTPARFADPRLVSLAARTQVHADPSIPEEAMEPARVRLTLRDGTVVERAFAGASVFDAGTVLRKSRTCFLEGLGAGPEAVARLEEAVFGLDRLADASALAAAFPARA
ncbi:MmgE/PrpD family protein [Aquabacter cavernae]|uniref:MmgE/PrpD family protein n=1 Tax=Aquabacter cavernae TaxID=2496029 RepID=UPI0013E088C9|nr:MmgE/PrpD family protein [Aquabacter cavernae]